jgi:hypothetical protein
MDGRPNNKKNRIKEHFLQKSGLICLRFMTMIDPQMLL